MTATRSTSPSELLIRQRLGALTRTLPAAQRGDPSSIHQARVATRRLREALPLVTEGARGRRLERTVRRLTQALGSVRELDVVLMTLDELEQSGDVPRTGIRCLRAIVAEERKRLHSEMIGHVGDCDFDRLRKKAVAAARKRDASRPGPRRARDPEQIDTAARRSARRASRVREMIERAAGIYLPDRLHEVRIAVKKLRYAMEIERELRRSKATARLLTLKKAQDLLGRMHDLEVLIARTRAVQSSPTALDLKLSGDLDRVVRRLENECRQLHGQYIASRPALLALCEQVAANPERARRGRRSSAA